MSHQKSVEFYREIQHWPHDERLLLEGARKKLTPDGKAPSEVIVVAHDETVPICCALIGQGQVIATAHYAFRQPGFLRKLPKIPLPSHHAMAIALYNEYIIVDPAVVFFYGLANGVLKPTYIVCHPEIPADYPVGFGDEESQEHSVHMPQYASVHR